MEETFKHKLDLYYLATIGYGVTLAAYVLITGWFVDDKFELVWKDPIVYLLASCATFSFIAMTIFAVLKRTVIVRDHQLVFRTRFKERVFGPEDIEWISISPERRPNVRREQTYPSARIKLRGRRRKPKLRSGSFERSGLLIRAIKEWAHANGVEVIDRRPRRRRGRAS
jgi:hypothetical protein